jgi:hypothetical protein
MRRRYESVRMEAKDVSARWLKACQVLNKRRSGFLEESDGDCHRKHFGDASYKQDDLLGADTLKSWAINFYYPSVNRA